MPTDTTFGRRHAQSTSHAMRCSRHPHSTAAVPFQSTATRWALYDEPDDGTPALGAYDPKDPNIPTFEDKMAKPAGFGGHSTAGTFGSDRSGISRSTAKLPCSFCHIICHATISFVEARPALSMRNIAHALSLQEVQRQGRRRRRPEAVRLRPQDGRYGPLM